MGVAFGVALALTATVLTRVGTDEKSIRLALRVTARWSFLLFWLAYAGGALATLMPQAFAVLAGRGREFGLAFAAAHLVHIGLIVRLGQILNKVPLRGWLLVFFAVAIFFTYLLALLSFGGLSQILGRGAWRAVMFIGMNYILIAFGRDFVLHVTKTGVVNQDFSQLMNYAPFAALCLIAPLLRIAAAQRRRGM